MAFGATECVNPDDVDGPIQDAVVGMTNGGGIRGNKVYDAGSIMTARDVFAELPFGNKTVVLGMSGADVMMALENAVSKIEANKKTDISDVIKAKEKEVKNIMRPPTPKIDRLENIAALVKK